MSPLAVQPGPALSLGADAGQLEARFQPVFRRIAEGAWQRERDHRLPHEPIRWLKEAGFGALRVPREHGGAGASLPQLFVLLIELAEADANLVQVLRSHFGFVEDCLNADPGLRRSAWFERFVRGDLVSDAFCGSDHRDMADAPPLLTCGDGGWTLRGRQAHDAACLFADWVVGRVRRADGGADRVVAVCTQRPGVLPADAGHGFALGTGARCSVSFKDAAVQPQDVAPVGPRFRYEPAFAQLVHLATLAGIGRAIERDLSHEVRLEDDPDADLAPLRAGDARLRRAIDTISAWVYAAEATALRAAWPAQRAYEARFLDNAHGQRQANLDAEVESAQGEVAVSALIARVSNDLRAALRASRRSGHHVLDWHWRHAVVATSRSAALQEH